MQIMKQQSVPFSEHIKHFLHPNLLEGSIAKSLLSFAFPLVVSYLFQQLYNSADTVIVGNFLHEKSLAAIGACAILFEIMLSLGNGIGSGMSIVAARAYGSGDMNFLKRVTAASLVINAVITVVITLLSLVSLKPLLILLGTPDEILSEAMSYISILGIFCGVLFAYNLCAGMLRAIGNSFMPLVFLVISSVLNIILDILFITKLGMGIEGTAIATVIAQGISVVLCVIYILKCAKILIPSFKSFSFKTEGTAKIYKELTAQGLSMAFMHTVVNSGTLILQSAINSFGTLIIAAHMATRKIFSLLTTYLVTVALASSTFTSQNFGAGKIDRVKKGVKTAILLAIGYALVLVALSPLMVKPLFTLISGSKNPQMMDYGTRYLYFAFPFFTVLGPLFILRNSLQGMGAKLLPIFSSILELCGKILFTAFIIPKIGINGIILCEPLIWCVMLIQLVRAYISRLRTL